MSGIITIQFRRGTTAQNETYTGKVGSLSVDLTKHTLRVHDGETTGGFELANTSMVESMINTAIGGDNVVNSVAGRSGNVTLTHADITDWDTAVGNELQAISDSLENYVLKTQLGAATTTTGEPGSEVTTVGVATLDANGKIPSNQLPALAITSVQVVANEAAKNALDNVQEGDFVVVTNAGSDPAISPRSYVYNGSAWVEITANNAVLSVNGYTGVVQLTKSDIGLGNVENYAVATQAQAEDILDPSNEAYMTPLRTMQMISSLGIIADEEGGVIDLGEMGDESESTQEP